MRLCLANCDNHGICESDKASAEQSNGACLTAFRARPGMILLLRAAIIMPMRWPEKVSDWVSEG